MDERLRLSIQAADLSPDRFVEALIPTMFSDAAQPDRVDEFAEIMAAFHPVGFRAMARSTAEADLRDVLRIAVPTLLLYGDEDARASLGVAEALHSAIPTSRLVVLTGVGHMSNVEAAERLNDEGRAFLRPGRIDCHPGVVREGRLELPRPLGHRILRCSRRARIPQSTCRSLSSDAVQCRSVSS